jgi:hypothetical protein
MSILTLSDLVTYRQEEYDPGPQRLSGEQLDMLGELGKRKKKKKGGFLKKFMKIRKWMPHAAVQRHISILKKLKGKIGKKKKKKSKRGGEEQAPEEAAPETTEEGAAPETPAAPGAVPPPEAAIAPSPYFDQPAIVAPAPSAYYPTEFFPPPTTPMPVPQPIPPSVAPSAYYEEPAVFLPAPSGYYPPSQQQMARMQQQEMQQAMEPEEEEEEEEGASPAPAPSMPSGPDMGPDEDGGEEGMWGLGFTIPFGSASAAVMRAANKGLVTSQPSSVDAGKVISAAGEGIAKAASAYFQGRALAKQARVSSATIPQGIPPAPYALPPSDEGSSKIPGWAWGVGIVAAGLLLVNMMKK